MEEISDVRLSCIKHANVFKVDFYAFEVQAMSCQTVCGGVHVQGSIYFFLMGLKARNLHRKHSSFSSSPSHYAKPFSF